MCECQPTTAACKLAPHLRPASPAPSAITISDSDSGSDSSPTDHLARAEDAILEMRAREAAAAMGGRDGRLRRCTSPERRRILGAIVAWEIRKLERKGEN